MTLVDPRCHLPYDLAESLEAYTLALPEELRTPGASQSLLRTVLTCVAAFHTAFVRSCERVYAIPEIAALTTGAGGFDTATWHSSLRRFIADEERDLGSWTQRHAECSEPRLQLRTTGSYLVDYSAQVGVLAARAEAPGVGASSLPRKTVSKFLLEFRSVWQMALYFVTCLQYFSLEMFEASNELAYMLHRGRAERKAMANLEDKTGMDEGASEHVWWKIGLAVPRFRLDQSRPLHHQELSAVPVVSELRRMSQLTAHGLVAERGRLLRFVEVGVFRANLSSYVWKRLARGRGYSLQMHLVDHWGAAHVSSGGGVNVASEIVGVGTGSNMAGASNSSLFHVLVRRFGQTSQCVQVPYWLPGGAPRAVVAMGGDVFFHRTTSVGAARSFDDGSLDVVYIDADHKWWSVLQDIAAWWPKIRIGGTMMGHDFHLNSLMEREGDPLGDLNDVPLAVLAFFRAPQEVVLHSGFVWSVEKRLDPNGDGIEDLALEELCALLRRRLPPRTDFEVCS